MKSRQHMKDQNQRIVSVYTSKAASAAEDALKRASRTEVETYAEGISPIM